MNTDGQVTACTSALDRLRPCQTTTAMRSRISLGRASRKNRGVRPSHRDAADLAWRTPPSRQACLEIAREPGDVYKYTNKATSSPSLHGTAVLGLGNIGAAAQAGDEGKAVLFKRFADIDVFDLELDTHDTEEFINAVRIMERRSAASTSKTSPRAECS